uniref:Uncharacterized protein n=1 Tax=uncultured bacterium contig00019 TaxID=1181510 RepID=A0A806K017_9BACT|nr:hypothetical protein [uncultured bacterium contig00019]
MPYLYYRLKKKNEKDKALRNNRIFNIVSRPHLRRAIFPTGREVNLFPPIRFFEIFDKVLGV